MSLCASIWLGKKIILNLLKSTVKCDEFLTLLKKLIVAKSNIVL